MNRGRKRTICHEAVISYAAAHPTMLQDDIATYFGTTQSRISHILCGVGQHGIHRGRPIKLRPNQTSEEYRWEKVLHDAGLGMDRGLRLSGKRILYGYDIRKEGVEDVSVTLPIWI
jgi:hypothetical protein